MQLPPLIQHCYLEIALPEVYSDLFSKPNVHVMNANQLYSLCCQINLDKVLCTFVYFNHKNGFILVRKLLHDWMNFSQIYFMSCHGITD